MKNQKSLNRSKFNNIIMKMKNNKKAGVINAVFMWIFATFFYFVIGYELVKTIVQEIFLKEYTGLMYYFGVVVPFIPVIGLMYWGYNILNPESVSQEDF